MPRGHNYDFPRGSKWPGFKRDTGIDPLQDFDLPLGFLSHKKGKCGVTTCAQHRKGDKGQCNIKSFDFLCTGCLKRLDKLGVELPLNLRRIRRFNKGKTQASAAFRRSKQEGKTLFGDARRSHIQMLPNPSTASTGGALLTCSSCGHQPHSGSWARFCEECAAPFGLPRIAPTETFSMAMQSLGDHRNVDPADPANNVQPYASMSSYQASPPFEDRLPDGAKLAPSCSVAVAVPTPRSDVDLTDLGAPFKKRKLPPSQRADLEDDTKDCGASPPTLNQEASDSTKVGAITTNTTLELGSRFPPAGAESEFGFGEPSLPPPLGLNQKINSISAHQDFFWRMEAHYGTLRVGIIVTGADSIIIYANTSFCQTTGHDFFRCVGKHCGTLLQSPNDVSCEQKSLMRSATSDKLSMETTLVNRKRNGTRFINDLSISPLRSGLFIGHIRDVTKYTAGDGANRTVAWHG